MANPQARPAGVRRGSTVFLQAVIVLFGAAVLTFMLWMPHLEGRNARATAFEVYFKDPFLAYVYVASIPFFVALAQGFRLLGFVAHDKVFSREAVGALRIVKYCAIALVGFVAVSVLFMNMDDPEDRPPGVMMRLAVAFPSIVVAAAAATFQRVLQHAVDMKSENDLTV